MSIDEGQISPEDESRFWSKVQVGEDDECWLWTASVDKRGYGQFRLNGRNVRAHRIAYRIANGEPLGDSLGCHSCDVRRCVNPRHVHPGTSKTNVNEMIARSRRIWHKGEDVQNSLLTDESVREIRNYRELYSQRELAGRYGVSRALIRGILDGTRWAHVR